MFNYDYDFCAHLIVAVLENRLSLLIKSVSVAFQYFPVVLFITLYGGSNCGVCSANRKNVAVQMKYIVQCFPVVNLIRYFWHCD